MWRTPRIAGFAGLLLAIGLVGVAPVWPENVRLGRAIPRGILDRVFSFRYDKEVGSCFVVDIDGRQYIITARHLVQGMADRAKVQMFANDQWQQLNVRPIWPQNDRTDIVALAADHLVAPKMRIVTGDDEIMVGQDVYFLGFPFGLATQFEKPHPARFAFIKKAILSAIDLRSESGHILYLDGHNNPGFSGGPVIFANYSEGDQLQIAGVVSGYRNQPIEVQSVEISDPRAMSAGKSKKRVVNYVLENTGIVVAYSFSEIEKAIRAKPIGPPLSEED